MAERNETSKKVNVKVGVLVVIVLKRKWKVTFECFFKV